MLSTTIFSLINYIGDNVIKTKNIKDYQDIFKEILWDR